MTQSEAAQAADLDRARVVRGDEEQRYQLEVDGRPVGLLTFAPSGSTLDLLHTEIDPTLEGRGWGTLLVEQALADIRRRGEQVLPHCPFVAAYLRTHPESVDLVPEPQRATFGLG